MRLVKKIFNKILFAVVVAVVFSIVNRCEVKAGYINTDYHFSYSRSDWNANYGDFDYIANLSNQYGAFFVDDDVVGGLQRNTICLFNTYATDLSCVNVRDYIDYLDFSQPVYWGVRLVPGNGVMLFISNNLPVLSNRGSTWSVTSSSNVVYLSSFMSVVSELVITPGGDITVSMPDVGSSQNYATANYTSNTNWNYATNLYVSSSNIHDNDFIVAPPRPIFEFEEKNFRIDDWVAGKEILTKITNYSDFINYSYSYRFVPTGGALTDFPYIHLDDTNILNIDGVGNFTYVANQSGTLFFRWDSNLNDDFGFSQYEVTGIDDNVAPTIDITANFNSSNDIIIDEILLDTDYNIISLNTSDYKCYYAFELDEDDPLDYQETDCSAGRLYVAHSNGIYNALIKKFNHDTNEWENIAWKAYYVYDYGKLVTEVYGGSSNNIFGKLIGGTNSYIGIYNTQEGPLKSIIILPLRLVTFTYQFFSSRSVCVPYDMGTIFGRHLVIGCIDLSVLGSPLLNTIDIIFAGFFSITWGLFLYKLFRKIILLRNLSVTGVFKGGIF